MWSRTPMTALRNSATRKVLLARAYTSKPSSTPLGSPVWTISKKVALRTLKVVNFVFAVHLFATYVARPSFMSGPSMLPTLADSGEMVIEEFLTYRLFPEKLERGDLITLESPIERGRIICKRVIGLPGDIICVDPTGDLAPSTEHVVVPKGHIWISGDNASASRDSRMYGPVPLGLVKGRLFARIWPPRAVTIFRNPITFLE